MSKWGITGVTTLTPDNKITNSTLIINGDRIEKVSKEKINTQISVTVDNAVLTPGLINGHDHLLGNYYPKVGNGPYENWLPWDNDLKSAPVYAERQQIENRDLYLLGGYRNLISGVTNISDLIPHFVQDPFLKILPTKVISNFTMAHSVASFALPWGDGIEKEHELALKNDIPFVTHCSEGFDPETRQDVQTLDRKGALSSHSVLVHGLAFSEEDIKMIKDRGASVVWCADSNMFMYNKTTNIKYLLDTGVNVCIGTDSPMSGGQNLLYEMKFDRELYKKLYHKSLSEELIVKMVTTNAAKAFRLKNSGHIKPGFIADFVIFAETKNNPYDSVVSAHLKDVLLVVIDGKPAYGDKKYATIFEALKVKYQNLIVDGVEKIIIGDLKGVTDRINRAVGFQKKFPFLPVEFK
ncbi:MAG: amidohydrolase family protein [Spirochaetes bacterium]|nr:amidohydrolase family protein [Spirochaetota bacterium]